MVNNIFAFIKNKKMNKTYCWKCVLMLASILGMIHAL